ncbi:ABC transporter ATP-binding protein [Paenibacillus contaminans]|uniref:ABC transporter n=1 Tax=Paenibacillus contaminans TaxID=450362 RepID=A0A329MLE6_9BACL|nr:ATP-binding cassette domain-containing protein [Paenibacillus contaminans]RAV20460.1 ABC transporter [Paenibacillus contaminans]
MAVIKVEGLCKSFAIKKKPPGLRGSVQSLLRPVYAEKRAVEGIEFQVNEGEKVAFLGPNGAGKSTTIKMLTGILHPTSGYADVLGLCPWKDRGRLAYRIGSVFGQKSQLWYHLPVTDSFELMGSIYELGKTNFLNRRDELIHRFGLEPFLPIPVRKLSLGERMRCEIAAALLHRPQVVFLDEPTIGLDVVVKQTIREVILEMNRREGCTIFLTTHDAGDIEQMCDRAIVINHGKIAVDDSVASMKSSFLKYKTVELKLKEPVEGIDFQGVRVIENGTSLKLSVDTTAVSIEEVLGFLTARCRIDDVTIQDPPLEETIAKLYAAEKEETAERKEASVK